MSSVKPEWLVRLENERNELSARMHNLHDFVFRSAFFGELLSDDRILLRQQYLAMEQYRTILDMRLQRAVDITKP